MRSMMMAFPVRFEIAGTAMQSSSRELGERGIFVYCANLPAPRTPVKLQLYLPGGTMEAPATVRTISGKPLGFWADFDDPTPDTHKRILKALASSFEQVATPAQGVEKFDPTKPAAARNRRAMHRSRERLAVAVGGVETVTVDLSPTGLFALLEKAPELDSAVPVALELPDGQPRAGVMGIVVRHGPNGIAVQFADADDSFRARLDAFLGSSDG